MHINIEVFFKLILSFWVCVARHARSVQNKKFAYLCNFSRKTWWMKLIFCLQIKMQVFYKVLVSLWFSEAKHAQSTQDNKSAIFCNISRKMKDEIDFLPADNRQRFLQNDTIILGVCMTKNTHITQNNKFAIFYNISIKKLVMKLICSMHISMKVAYKLVLWFWWGWSTQSSQNHKFAMPLQYLKK